MPAQPHPVSAHKNAYGRSATMVENRMRRFGMEELPMQTDTVIRHVTKPGANLFLELGFPSVQAKRLRAASKKQIDNTRQRDRPSTGQPSRPR
jgi:hypothetical protein